MLHAFCLNLVRASAVVVCVGLAASACVVRERVAVRHEPEHHEEHHDDHHDRR
jgi:hypothetical protein